MMRRMLLGLMAALALAAGPSLENEIAQWRRARAAALQAEGGWLTVAGLFWLHDGANSFWKEAQPLIREAQTYLTDICASDLMEKSGHQILLHGNKKSLYYQWISVVSQGRQVIAHLLRRVKDNRFELDQKNNPARFR